MITRIYHRDRFVEVKLNEPPLDARMLDSFLLYNKSNICFVRAVGGWYKITRECGLQFVSRTLYLLSLEEWLAIANNDKFISNTR
jgi:hypothetical protein